MRDVLASVSNGLGMAENGRKSRQNWAPNLPGKLSTSSPKGLGGVAVGDRSGQQGWAVVNLRRGWAILAKAGQASDRGLLFPQLCSTGSRGISFFPESAPPALSPYAPVPAFPGSTGGIL